MLKSGVKRPHRHLELPSEVFTFQGRGDPDTGRRSEPCLPSGGEAERGNLVDAAVTENAYKTTTGNKRQLILRQPRLPQLDFS